MALAVSLLLVIVLLVVCDKPDRYPKSAPRMGVLTMWAYILTLPASQVRFSKWTKCVTSVPVECTPRPSEVQFGVRIGGFMLCAVRRRGSQLLCGSRCGDLVIVAHNL